MKMKYPDYICYECGIKASKGKSYSISTWYMGKCPICEKEKPVTELRDFFYPQLKDLERLKNENKKTTR